MADRIQKVLANAGLASRREVERWIRQGRILVDDRPAQLGDQLEGSEKIRVDGKPIHLGGREPRKQFHLLYYKPTGEITTRHDPEGRPTVFASLREPRRGRWISVGRLDVNTSGLLLLTSDGELAHRLMHPSFEIEREYAVRLLGALTSEQLRQLRAGVELDDGEARFERIRLDGGSGSNVWYRIALREGRNRVIRRIFESLGIAVSRLIRVRYGPVQLGDMRRGSSRQLTEPEAAALYDAVGMNQRE